MFSLGGGTCYDLVNAYACFCPDRIFRPQCNTTMPIKHTMPIPIGNENNNLRKLI